MCVRGCVWIVPACERHACLSNNLKCVALLSRRPFFLDILCICSKEAEEGRKRQRGRARTAAATAVSAASAGAGAGGTALYN